MRAATNKDDRLMAAAHDPALVQTFAKNFPIEGGSVAKVRFDNLFVPLALIYAFSLPMLVGALLSNLGVEPRDKKYWSALILVPIFVLAPALMVFDKSQFAQTWQAHVVAGDAWGYVVWFIIFPVALLGLTAALPNRDCR
jgi:hypothetical protein